MGFNYLSLVVEYISYLQFLKGFSPSYCCTSKYILRSWFDITYDLYNFDVDNTLDFVDMWFDSKLTDSTIKNYISRLSSFFSFLAKKSLINCSDSNSFRSQINKDHTTIHSSITIIFARNNQSRTAKKHMPTPFIDKKPQYRGVEII